ncbi:hypothetical protein I7I50_00336 [Histoplasma capsulatum G186AR]|uniref:Uncharacterized protein n=1 Tax=Ajellomyces capsulatus TaxID=5037 RepID=A0A8H7YJD8_AJECA|nr:hypothetical protein I7I52_07604 [Histoplasma capsulatum]QSS72476.1 hypothetical protein I7I50_00336 [Histoplasma capsulatum G186AR]
MAGLDQPNPFHRYLTMTRSALSVGIGNVCASQLLHMSLKYTVYVSTSAQNVTGHIQVLAIGADRLRLLSFNPTEPSISPMYCFHSREGDNRRWRQYLSALFLSPCPSSSEHA